MKSEGVLRVGGLNHIDLVINFCRRIHTESSKVVEMVEMSSDQDVHRRGLHLVFEDNLSSHACVIPSQVCLLAHSLSPIYVLAEVLELILSVFLKMIFKLKANHPRSRWWC